MTATVAPRHLRPLFVLTVALVFVLAGAAPADAGVRDFRVGVVGNKLSDGDLRTIGTSGADVLRVNFSWRRAEVQPCTAGGYDWTAIDQIVTRAHEGGYRLLATINDSPSYVSRSGMRAPDPGNARHMRNYDCFVRALVHRYGRGGVLPTTTGVTPVTDWQVWNEPNMRAYSSLGRSDPRLYARLVKPTARALRAHDPMATVVLAGMPEYVKRGQPLRKFLRGFYRVRRIERAFDVVAIHPFAWNTAGVRGALVRLRETLASVGDRRRAVWVTETSWSTGGSVPEHVVKSARGQARELRRVFTMLRNERKRFKVGTVTWFNWRDLAERGKPNAFLYAGIYRFNGKPKRSCRAFVALAGGHCVAQIDDTAPTVTSGDAQEAQAQATLVPSPPE